MSTTLFSCGNSPEIGVAILLIVLVPALVGTLVGVFLKDSKVRIADILCIISCIGGIFALPAWIICGNISVILGIGSAYGSYAILIDEISAIMMTVSSLVFFMIMVHRWGSYHTVDGKYSAAVNGLFIACMLAMCADSVAVLFLGWEAVSLLTYLMAFTEKGEEYRRRFFVITHIGGFMLLIVYVTLWIHNGTDILSQWTDFSGSATVASILLLLTFLGFGSKLGTVPFHAWMPEMYGESPTHTSALLSTVCSNVAVLMLFKTVFGYIGVDLGQTVAMIILVLSCITALWGAMESIIQTEPKKILAYSSMENMALVTLCMSIAILFWDVSESLTVLVLIAGLLHTLNHSVFKSLMLLTVHTIEDSTGEKDIALFGGIGLTLRGLSIVALIGVASLAAIPPFNGFASEWLMVQSMILGDVAEPVMRLIMPLTVAVLGVCGMMAATSYARLYGFTFLGRPRSKGAADPKAVKKIVFTPLLILAAMCILMGLGALEITDGLSAGIMSFLDLSGFSYHEELSGNFMPLLLGLVLIGTIAILAIIFKTHPSSATHAGTWDCGGELDEHMQYSSQGFTQPLVRVFHPIYGDMTEMEDDGKGNFTIYHVKFIEPFVKYIYNPIWKGISYVSEKVGKLQTGNIQSYFAYILVTLVIALLVVRFI